MAIDIEEVDRFLSKCGENTEIYLGCDSRVELHNDERIAKYTTAIVIHVDGCRGGKLFYETEREKDFSPSRKKPSVRLMREVHKVSDLYLRLVEGAENCLDKNIEIHIDISVNKENKSSVVVQEALGYVHGVCQVKPKLKPEAFAASTVADNW